MLSYMGVFVLKIPVLTDGQTICRKGVTLPPPHAFFSRDQKKELCKGLVVMKKLKGHRASRTDYPKIFVY